MSTLKIVIATIIVAIISWSLTGVLRHYALTYKVLDIPNERSSHSRPVPRGGGLAIVIVFLVTMSWIAIAGIIDNRFAYAVIGGGIAVAAIGLFDDLWRIPVILRLTTHLLAASWVVYWLGNVSSLNLGITTLNLNVIGMLVTTLYLVWFLNLFNFMDGIDGIASVEAVFISATAVMLIGIKDGNGKYILPILLLVPAIIGFLIWNWPTAKIFLGDVGSGFLGFVLGVFTIYTVVRGILPVWAWLILCGSFIVDATVTLLRRMCRGKQIYQAHRSHAYQRLGRYWGSHLPVLLLYLGLNVFWLLPLASIATLWPQLGALLTLVAWAPLVFGVWILGAGLPGELNELTER